MKIRQTKDFHTISKLNDQIFQGELLDVSRNIYGWLAHIRDDIQPIGFCTATDLGERILFLSRCGVRKNYRGLHLQRRFIQTRLRFAKKKGFKKVITYVQKKNYPSLCNLIKCGFLLYEPEYQYAGDDFLYLIYEIRD